MKRWLKTCTPSALRRALAFERCEDRLALDGSSWLLYVTSDALETSGEGGVASVANLADHDAYDITFDKDTDLASSSIHFSDAISTDGAFYTSGGWLSEADARSYIVSVFGDNASADDASGRSIDLIERSDSLILVDSNPPRSGDGSPLIGSDDMVWVPTAPTRSDSPDDEGGLVDVAPFADLPLAWAIARNANDVHSRASLAADHDAQALRMRAIHFEVAHSAPTVLGDATRTPDSEALAARPIPLPSAAETVALTLASLGEEPSLSPKFQRVDHVLADGAAPPSTAPARAAAAEAPADAASPAELRLAARPSAYADSTETARRAAERDAAFASLDPEALSDVPAEPVTMSDPWRRETVGLAVVAALVGEWAASRRRLVGGARDAVTQRPPSRQPRGASV